MGNVHDVHQRSFKADLAVVGRQFDTLGTDSDDWWVTDLVQPLRMNRGLDVGSIGGHGTVRYQVIERIPGRRVTFEFDPSIGLTGTHTFLISGSDERVHLTHELTATTTGSMTVLWPVIVFPIHSGVIEDIFDHVERTATGEAHRQHVTSGLVRRMSRLGKRGF